MGELKIYEVKEKDWDNINARRCVTCAHYAIDKKNSSSYCDIDKHYISYIDYDGREVVKRNGQWEKWYAYGGGDWRNDNERRSEGHSKNDP